MTEEQIAAALGDTFTEVHVELVDRIAGYMTPEERLDLARLFIRLQDTEGLSSSIIAIRYRLSRNAVCGIVHRGRIKLGMRRPTQRHVPNTLRKARQDPAVAPLVAGIRPARSYRRKAEKAAVAPPKPVGGRYGNSHFGAFHICDLKERQCRFPTKTTMVTHLFCGAPCDLESSWCPDHRLVVFQPIVNRPKQAQDA